MPGTKMQIILVSIILIASLALLVTEKIAVDKTAMASWLPWHSPAFINNTPVVVLFIPIVMGLSCECDFSPSKLLIPLPYVSILGGTCTLIGTSTNIIVSDLATTFGFEPLSMFELGKVGIPIAIIGMVFLFFVSSRIFQVGLPLFANWMKSR